MNQHNNVTELKQLQISLQMCVSRHLKALTDIHVSIFEAL